MGYLGERCTEEDFAAGRHGKVLAGVILLEWHAVLLVQPVIPSLEIDILTFLLHGSLTPLNRLRRRPSASHDPIVKHPDRQ